ncbi:MAG: phosphodiester glycosidase family protein [Oscillochloridaceae bacterium]|nr:phosphodiester glycosidase family protein [Chloroflexaceae bacterium]MDW8391644.1 phosphodiester glycosidase family protein [Oscillochloridaceae bacterium]
MAREPGQSVRRRLSPGFVLWLLAALISACGATGGSASSPTGASMPTLMPTPTGIAAPTAVVTAAPADTGWLFAAPGVETRRLRASVAGRETTISAVRLDPQQVRFRVGYAPEAPLPLASWAEHAGARVAINGGFFDADGRSVALLVHDGQLEGSSYVGQGGMFAVSPGGAVWLQSLAESPFDPDVALAQALQGWPMLIKPGLGASYHAEDYDRARRSALGLDHGGRVVLIVASAPVFTLSEFSAWLAASDLELESAVNLDGGASSGLIVRSDSAPERIEPFVPLPIVLLALPA